MISKLFNRTVTTTCGIVAAKHAMVRGLALLTIALTVSVFCAAQAEEPPKPEPAAPSDEQHSIDSVMQVLRADMNADRATIIAREMDFGPKDGAAFWPIYNQYQYERSRVDDLRVSVIRKYSEKYVSLTDDDVKTMVQEMFDYDSQLTALKRKYFKKFEKVISPYTVARFFQLEHRLDLIMDVKVESSLPALQRSKFEPGQK